MKITGFTFIKDAIIYDYPVVESIKSILPLCDDFVVAVGKSKDETREIIKSIDKNKIRIIDTVWDEKQRKGGEILSTQTNIAFKEIGDDSDWAFYIQGDEIVHEKYLDRIYKKMKEFKGQKRIDGLLFKYLHFYGSYDYTGSSSKWYKHEIRIVKNNKNIYSYRDAQGFRKDNNKLLDVKPIDAYIYHYGWVKNPSIMQKKQEVFNKYWHDDEWIKKNIDKREEYDYHNIDSLQVFEGTHPKVMTKRVSEKNWEFNHNISRNKSSIKTMTKNFLNRYLHIDLSYKNYRIV